MRDRHARLFIPVIILFVMEGSSVSHNSLILVKTRHGDICFFLIQHWGSGDGLSLRNWHQDSWLERKCLREGAICVPRACQQVLVHRRPIPVTISVVRGQRGKEGRSVACTRISLQESRGWLSSESFWCADWNLRQPVWAVHSCAMTLLLQLLRGRFRLWRTATLQKGFYFISGLNAIHLMNLTVQKTFRIETHIQIL